MKHFTYRVTALSLLLITFLISPLQACDDTLVMLLTAKNPTSEFSKTIRNFMNSLTVLGSALKYTPKADYDTETKAVLEAWLEFSKRYMTNPPEEAKNDRQWREKMSNTAQKIGLIRKLVNNQQYIDAHNNILELSNTIGTFFDAVGISEEKKIFLTTSADINDLQRLIETKSYNDAKQKLAKLTEDLTVFKSYITAEDIAAASATAFIIDSISIELSNNDSTQSLSDKVANLRTSFEGLRSRILMNEWFSSDDNQNEGD